jgi:hypothetical protein
MQVNRRIGLILLGAVIASQASACAWDYDTLSQEAQKSPDVLAALVGRVRTFPPEYYEFRIRRSSEIVAKDPKNLDELDNLIVAHDKLKDAKASFRYLAMKRKALDAKPNKDHEYRYWANLGTVEAHEWVRQGKKDDALIKSAIKNLETCIKLNPSAHFGREIVQVRMLQVMLEQVQDSQRKTPRAYDEESALDVFMELGRDKIRKGAIGMMSVGSGPDSAVLVAVLSHSIEKSDGILGSVAANRLSELVNGHSRGSTRQRMSSELGRYDTTSYKDFPFGDILRSPMDFEQVDAEYDRLRQEAREYRKLTDDYIKTRLKQGKHPDNDPRFWDDWQVPPAPVLNSILNPGVPFTTKLIAAFVGLIGVLIPFGIYRLVRRRSI